MSVGGARGTRGAGAAERRLLATLLALLTLLPAFLALAPAAEAQAVSDPWWGPNDRSLPTNGWAVRVPITVENTKTYPVMDAIALANVDFGKLLVRSGWTNRTAGTDVTLRGFTLDVDSIRVIEYGRGFSPGPIGGPATLPTPHRFYPATLDGPRTRDFDAQRNPAGTLAFHLPGVLAPSEKRFFYAYANPLEFEAAPMKPHVHTLESTSVLDSFLWGTTGQTFYGFEPHQQGQDHKLQVRPLTQEPTKVEVQTQALGRFTTLPPTGTFPNPITLDNGQPGTFYVPAGSAWKIVADRPVAVMQHGRTTPPPTQVGQDPEPAGEWRGFVPSTTGSYAGSSFWFYSGTTSTPQKPTADVTIVRASPGSATVSATGLNGLPGGGTASVSGANPTMSMTVPANQWVRLTATGTAKVLVMLGPSGTAGMPIQGHQVPALSGGPAGNDFIAFVPPDGGFTQVCSPVGNASARIVDTARPGQQLEPEGPVQSTQPLLVPVSPICKALRTGGSWPSFSPVELYTVKPDEEGRAENVRVLVGAETRTGLGQQRPITGYYGGPGATSFAIKGKFGVFGHYNDTRITLFVERERSGVRTITNETFALSADGFRPLAPEQFADATGRFGLSSTKPIQVVSLVDAGFPYATFVPGRPEPPTVTVGNAEFRGPLIELRSREKDGRQDFRSTGPGTPVSFPLEVVNLGRWTGGDTLADTVTLTCSALPGWTVEGCGGQLNLGGATAERLDVLITPPADALNVNGTFTVEARSKHGNVVSSMKLLVFVEIRYGVGMWFDVEGGRKTIDPAIGVDPGESYRYNVLVKNTGSAQDTFDLVADPEARPGWTQELLLDGEPVTRITLEGGESRILHFLVTAPDTETAQQNIVSIKAQSVGSALAGDVVNTATRIRPKVSISMALDPQTRVAAPNETALFNVTVTNTGNDIFLVQLRSDALLPTGWAASFNLDPPEVNLNPNPGRDPSLSYTFQLRVTPPPGSRAGDLATLKLTVETDTGGGVRIPGDQASAVVVVQKVHNVTTPPLLDARVGPGDELRYVLPVTNHGNGNDFIELLPGAVEASLVAEGAERARGWRVQAEEESLYLDYNESADLPLRVGVPDGAPAGLYNVTFTLRLSRESFQNLTIPVLVEPTPRVEFRGETSLDLAPGRPHQLSLRAVNTGNLAGAYDLEAVAPAGWNATFRPARAQLAPGESTPVTLVLNASRDAAAGAHDVQLRATLETRPAGATGLSVAIARPDLTLERVDARGSTSPGELVLVEATVRNSGAIAADNVTVVLLVEGSAVDQVVLGRVPVGAAGVATLSWVSTKRTSDLRVVIDPADEIAQQSATEDDESPVVFAGRLTPGPAAALVALVVALAAFGFRRRPA